MCDLSSQFSSAQAPDVGRAMPKIILVEKKCAHGTSAANVLHPCTISRTFSSRKSIPLNPRRWPPAPLDPPDPPRPRACRPGGPGGQNLCQGQRFASPPRPGPPGRQARDHGSPGGPEAPPPGVAIGICFFLLVTFFLLVLLTPVSRLPPQEPNVKHSLADTETSGVSGHASDRAHTLPGPVLEIL